MLAEGLSAAQMCMLESYLDTLVFAAPGHVFREGEAGDSLFIARDAVVDIHVPLKFGRCRRIASFAPGTVFGELALLEGQPRNADAVVRGAGTVWELRREALTEIGEKHPEIASRILLNLGRSLAGRVRTTTAGLRAAIEAA